ncbi:type II methionyl aminopeptidase [Candidatus Woesearchaeota archaeon]|nr:type II methionyl aminopeptidase [Candidatus Woesearchaeota archaeon]HIH37968.1 type II methionyl aminopeptidase [Candidatus Woesearchaeota archaeon]HIH48580.1 type II methionyl aminopeptidase [Candidatus Woesearchaeota archaeon]HIJ03571.1 type II methionyl aminopeptidase [Candidatus Woesearchaeota archaeon]
MEGNSTDWILAGKITKDVLDYGKTLIKPGASYTEVTELIEKKILELGGKPAFPPQMSLNEVAAHFTTNPGEDIIFSDHLVSLDCGVHVNGAIGDSAVTVDLSGEYDDLVKSAEDAVEQALKIVGVGVTLGEIGKAIQETIEGYGYHPVKNLSGHGLGIYQIHKQPSIPNIATGDPTPLEDGMVIAIEPFSSTGAGAIYESSPCNIYTLKSPRNVRSPMTRQVLQEIMKYEGLPFTTRWLAKKFPLGQIRFALREMETLGMLEEHPPLPDKAKGMVAQAEHTVIVGKKCIITTR